jgi:hypothetical protein
MVLLRGRYALSNIPVVHLIVTAMSPDPASSAPPRLEPAPASHRALTNPIYRHLTRHRRWPSERTSVLLCLAFTLIAIIVLYLLSESRRTLSHFGPFVTSFRDGMLFSTIIIIIAFINLPPLISAIITAITTASAADEEMFTLVRLTKVKPRVMVTGYLYAALFRLRWLWIVCFGSIVPLFLSLLMGTLKGNPLKALIAFVESFSSEGYFVLWVVFTVVVFATGSNILSVCVNLWAGLHFRRIGPSAGVSVITGVVTLTMFPIVVLLTYFITRYSYQVNLDINLSGFVFLIAGAAYCAAAFAFFSRAITEQSRL